MAKKQSDKVREAAQEKRLNNAIKTRVQEEMIAEALERQNDALDKGLKTIDLETILKQRISDIDDKQKEQIERKKELEKEIVEARKKYFGVNKKIATMIEADNEEKIKNLELDEQIYRDAKERALDQNALAMEYGAIIEESGDKAKALGDGIKGFVEGLPGGKFLSKQLGIQKLGDDLQEQVINNMIDGFDSDAGGSPLGMAKKGFGQVTAQVGVLARRLYALVMANPITALATAAIGLFMLFRKIDREARNLSNELSIGRDQLDGQLMSLKFQEAKFKALNLDASKLKSTLTTLSTEFRDLSLITAENAANIERFAQNAGVGGDEVAKLNKKLMVMTGLSFDAALNMQEQAAAMAEAEGVATGRVLGDIASAAEEFARFSQEGADGLAQAAIEAAKVGLSLSSVLKVADELLDFEKSITAEFEAQVVTGQALNLEGARQAALAGDEESLLQEIRSVAMGVNLETMNVIQKDAIAGAIGLSVSDLMRVSRGESLDKQDTMINLQKEGNEIALAAANNNKEKLAEISDNTKPTAGGGADNLTGLQFEMG